MKKALLKNKMKPDNNLNSSKRNIKNLKNQPFHSRNIYQYINLKCIKNENLELKQINPLIVRKKTTVYEFFFH